MMPPWGKTGSLFNYQQCGLVHFSIIIDAYSTDWLTFQLSTAQLVHFSIIIDVHGKSWLTFQLENGSVFIPSFSSFSLKLVTISIKNWFTIHLTKTEKHVSSAFLLCPQPFLSQKSHSSAVREFYQYPGPTSSIVNVLTLVQLLSR